MSRHPATIDELSPASQIGHAIEHTIERVLRRIVREELREVLAESAPAKCPALLDKQMLAQTLNCSIAHIDNLRRRGLPGVHLGDAVRFDLAEVVAWLRAHGRPEAR